jgi:hypothetical protein
MLDRQSGQTNPQSAPGSAGIGRRPTDASVMAYPPAVVPSVSGQPLQPQGSGLGVPARTPRTGIEGFYGYAPPSGLSQAPEPRGYPPVSDNEFNQRLYGPREIDVLTPMEGRAPRPYTGPKRTPEGEMLKATQGAYTPATEAESVAQGIDTPSPYSGSKLSML